MANRFAIHIQRRYAEVFRGEIGGSGRVGEGAGQQRVESTIAREMVVDGGQVAQKLELDGAGRRYLQHVVAFQPQEFDFVLRAQAQLFQVVDFVLDEQQAGDVDEAVEGAGLNDAEVGLAYLEHDNVAQAAKGERAQALEVEKGQSDETDRVEPVERVRLYASDAGRHDQVLDVAQAGERPRLDHQYRIVVQEDEPNVGRAGERAALYRLDAVVRQQDVRHILQARK